MHLVLWELHFGQQNWKLVPTSKDNTFFRNLNALSKRLLDKSYLVSKVFHTDIHTFYLTKFSRIKKRQSKNYLIFFTFSLSMIMFNKYFNFIDHLHSKWITLLTNQSLHRHVQYVNKLPCLSQVTVNYATNNSN